MPDQPRFRNPFLILSNLSPWTWIALLFFLHTVGSLLVIRMVRLDVETFVLPLALTLLGAIGAVVLGKRYGKDPTWPAWSRWFPALVYAVHIAALSSRDYPGADVGFSTDYFHPVEFCVLGFFLSFAQEPALTGKGMFPFWIRVLSFGAFWGMIDEFHQAFVPGRSCSFTDFCLDIIGTAAGGVIYLAFARMWRKGEKAALRER